jgi:hypothetical protein
MKGNSRYGLRGVLGIGIRPAGCVNKVKDVRSPPLELAAGALLCVDTKNLLKRRGKKDAQTSKKRRL